MAWPPARLRPQRDTWQRHRLTARLLEWADGSGLRVLDVGGVTGRLAAHVPGAEVVTANVREPADVVFDGARLPFVDRAFDAAVSLDVLEHLAPARRREHVAETLRVAGRRAVLCCPLGTAEHVAAERELADWYARLSGRREPFLDEHNANGLPAEDELRALARGWPGFESEMRFHGDFRAEQALFRLEALAVFRRRPVLDRARFAWRRLRTPLGDELEARSTPFSNRAYVALQRVG